MRLAPPVRVRCAGGRAWRALQCGLPALALAATATWVLALREQPLWPALVAGLLCGALRWRQLQPRVCMLEWDGTRWSVDGQPGIVEVMMDLGSWLLLRQRAQVARSASEATAPRAVEVPRVRWLAVTASEAGPAMHGLRAALYAPAPPVR